MGSTPLEKKMAASGLLMCQRMGCSARYRADQNPEGCCRFHSGPVRWGGVGRGRISVPVAADRGPFTTSVVDDGNDTQRY